MLTQLKIENYALIRELDISPSSTINIITGETGAGKSIMLGAVGLLLGKRADSKVLSDRGKKCIIEGVFDIGSYALSSFFDKEDLDYQETSIIRREITPAGKSRAFINDTPVTLDVMKQLGRYLMDVHSQHDTLTLKDNSFHLSLIDYFAGNSSLLTNYQNQYKSYKEHQRQLKKLEEEIATLQNEHDYHQFLLNEFTEANLQLEEQETLEQELLVLDNAEEIKSNLHLAIALFSDGEQAIESSLTEVKNSLRKVVALSPGYQELYQRMESAYIELKDISSEIESGVNEVAHDPNRINFVKERLGLVYQLEQKHKVSTILELLQIEKELEDKVVKATTSEDDLHVLKASIKLLEADLREVGSQLSNKREQVFDKLKEELEKLLQDVGMPDALIEIRKENIEPTFSGVDKISLLFSANKGVSPSPISEVASGGELSRLMFCMKYILANKTSLPTIIFDEIDTGVSGEVAMKMGRMMSAMADNHQVITITHLPQIAAVAKSHYFVYKDEEAGRAVSRIRLLNKKEQIEEIAMMIGGNSPSEAAYYSAKELIG